MLAEYYHRRFGLHVVRARPFNHTGPGQSPHFVCSDFARQIAAIDLGLRPPRVHVGNLKARRDFSDVRDIVRAYELLLETGAPGEAYNVASGRGTSVRQVLRLLKSFCSYPIRMSVQRHRLRPTEGHTLYASNRKLRRATSWKPEYALRKTLSDLYLILERPSAGGKAMNPEAASPTCRPIAYACDFSHTTCLIRGLWVLKC